jgi:hypothetical protein
VGHAKTFRQVAETTVKTDLGEEGDRTGTSVIVLTAPA